MNILYCAPFWHAVSFTLIAQKHIEYIKKLGLANVQTLDELSFASFIPSMKYVAILHPWIYIYHRFLLARERALNENLKDKFQPYLSWWRSRFDKLIAVEVCDSDRLSDFAVNLLNQADKIIYPSSFCVEVAKASGVKVPIVRVPHGVDPEWYSMPNQWETAPIKQINPLLIELYLHKIRKKKRLLLFWLWHSSDRKGWPEVLEFYKRLVKERKDVTLVLKTMSPRSLEFQDVMPLGAIEVYGFLSEYEKMCLYDLADITLCFSRGGGFEHNALESLARGIPVITSDWGSWTDYVPQFLQARRGRKVIVLPNNAIHVGYGYTIDVESALDKAHDILDNYEEYKAKVDEWRQKVLVKEYNWEVVARRIVEECEKP
jgi:glycosyltransferase involved in cell wall biosynthesis